MLTALTPRHLFRTAVDLELHGARALAAASGSDEASLEWVEHGNRLHVFSLFHYADVVLGGTAAATLAELVNRTWDFSPYDRVWVTEGIGYLWGARTIATVPESALVPLHSGIGLSIARQVLQDPAARADIDLVATLVDRCLDCAAPGFECVSVEAIGLAVRNLQPQLALHFDHVLTDADRVFRACFWHGFGRGAYFATSNWRGAAEQAADAIHDLGAAAPDDAARLNAIAGFVWAATLVNLPTPEVLMRYLAQITDEDAAVAFAEGVTSSLVVWQHAAPDDDGIASLLACDSPEGAHERAEEWWNALVRAPAQDAVRLYPALAARGRLQHVFHCEGV
jgi:hypothetical protein